MFGKPKVYKGIELTKAKTPEARAAEKSLCKTETFLKVSPYQFSKDLAQCSPWLLKTFVDHLKRRSGNVKSAHELKELFANLICYGAPDDNLRLVASDIDDFRLNEILADRYLESNSPRRSSNRAFNYLFRNENTVRAVIFTLENIAPTTTANSQFMMDMARGALECRAYDFLKYLIVQKRISISYAQDLFMERGRIKDSYDFIKDNFQTLKDQCYFYNDSYCALLAESVEKEDKSFTAELMSHFREDDYKGLDVKELIRALRSVQVVSDLLESNVHDRAKFAEDIALSAVKRCELGVFDKWFNQYEAQIDSERVLEQAFKSDRGHVVKRLYAKGVKLTSTTAIDNVMNYAAGISSQEFLENCKEIKDTSEKHACLLKLTKKVMGRNDVNLDYLGQVFDALPDHGEETLNTLLSTATSNEKIDVVAWLVERGGDLKTLSNNIKISIAESFDENKLQQMIDMGLVFGGAIDACIRKADDIYVKDFLKGVKVTELKDRYPKWEKQDKNTVAEISFVRKAEEDGFVLLRRAFNFRSGFVDQAYEIHKDGKLDDFKPANTLQMSDFDKDGLIAVAKRELLARDGEMPDMLRAAKGKADKVNLQTVKGKKHVR